MLERGIAPCDRRLPSSNENPAWVTGFSRFRMFGALVADEHHAALHRAHDDAYAVGGAVDHLAAADVDCHVIDASCRIVEEQIARLQAAKINGCSAVGL